MPTEPGDSAQGWPHGETTRPTGDHSIGRSTNDLVTAVVAADGRPERLSIRPQAMGLSAEDLADEVLTALQAAHRNSFEQVLQQFEDLPSGLQTPSVHNALAVADQVRTDVARHVVQVTEEFDEVRRKLQNLMGTLD